MCIVPGWLVGRKLNKNGMKRSLSILIAIGCSVALLAVFFIVYFSIYYHAGDSAKKALEGNDLVSVEKIDGGYYFDGPGEESAIVFYSGGKVESEAYAPLMLKLSDAGFDCFLADMPLNFPLFRVDIADKFVYSYDYDTWILAGHSMGGVAASYYVEKHTGEIDGLVMLASYPTEKIDDSVSLLLIYGIEDGCMDKRLLDQSSSLWPKNTVEYVISGGNHAQFGDYGNQKCDGVASITCDEQLNETVRAVKNAF